MIETALALAIVVAVTAVVYTSKQPLPSTESVNERARDDTLAAPVKEFRLNLKNTPAPTPVKATTLNLASLRAGNVDDERETGTGDSAKSSASEASQGRPKLTFKATKVIPPPSRPVIEQLEVTADAASVSDEVDEDGVLNLAGKEYTHLSMWDPVAVNYTRKLRLDDSGKIYTMRTVATTPPVFEIEDFLDESDCDAIIRLASENGLHKSNHIFLDGSNLGDEQLDTNALSADEAQELFRHSDQTWLGHNSASVLRDMYARVQALTRLPAATIRKMEELQVVRYRDGGHYESHYDSEASINGPCCADPVARERGLRNGYAALNGPVEKRCRLCRFMTVLYYLDDTEEGGGTVFPLADLNDEEMEEFRRSTHPLKFKQTRTCSPGKVVLPKKRKAVMWYNHHVDRGFLGERHEQSLHGGCNVIKGTKWIANHWITELPHPDVPRTPATAMQS